MFGHGPSLSSLLVLGFMYFVPAIVAFRRKHQNATPITVLNLFLGWTVIGWVAALIWSLTAAAPKPAGYVVVQGVPANSMNSQEGTRNV
jgi:CHASE2 domain-containing sensor protein